MATEWKKDYLRYKGFFLNILNFYNTKPNLKIYLELTLSLITILVFSIFAIKPTILTIIDLSKEIKDKEEKIEIMNKKIADLGIASNILEEESSRLPLILNSVPKKVDLDIMIKQFEISANNSGVEILSLSSSEVDLVETKRTETEQKRNSEKEFKKMPENTTSIPFRISVTGSYINLFSFLNELENLKRPIMFDSISLNSNIVNQEKALTLVVSGRLPYLF